ncbi:cation:proton antiporter [Bordetella genomosp. 5]|uniref:cation:proton antiporter n=1 Tax=Bordetella genomosp. 5 TaxID=1395608 RepID=UPI001C3DB535|nr:monovalent cation/H(+) antiporter subunit G [Bordetella genomosp. 5]
MLELVMKLAGMLLQIAGFIFLIAAAVGLLRFSDPLQRMHASTKAGTIGAGLTVAGVALGSGNGLAIAIAALTVLFLIFTVPVAGHLLGRAIYFSGEPLLGLEGRDALHDDGATLKEDRGA